MSKESDERKRRLNGEPEHKSEYQWKKEANARYHAKCDQIAIRIPKGQKDVWRRAAEKHKLSLTQYLTELIHTDNPDLFPAEDNERHPE